MPNPESYHAEAHLGQLKDQLRDTYWEADRILGTENVFGKTEIGQMEQLLRKSTGRNDICFDMSGYGKIPFSEADISTDSQNQRLIYRAPLCRIDAGGKLQTLNYLEFRNLFVRDPTGQERQLFDIVKKYTHEDLILHHAVINRDPESLFNLGIQSGWVLVRTGPLSEEYKGGSNDSNHVLNIYSDILDYFGATSTQTCMRTVYESVYDGLLVYCLRNQVVKYKQAEKTESFVHHGLHLHTLGVLFNGSGYDIRGFKGCSSYPGFLDVIPQRFPRGTQRNLDQKPEFVSGYAG